jgi:hypothetical protein
MLLLLSSAFLGGCYWYRRESAELLRHWQDTLGNPTAQSIARAFWERTVLFMIPIVIMMGLFMLYEWKLQNAQKAAEDAQFSLSQKQAELTTLEAAHAAAEESISTMKTEIAGLKARVAAAPAPSVSYLPGNEGSGIEGLYNPEESGTGQQATLDRIKKRYEELLVNNMFMKKCGKAQPTDIHVIISALGQEMASVNAPGRLQYDILTAARGSFEEMYSQSPCDTEAANASSEHYRQYIQNIARSLGE